MKLLRLIPFIILIVLGLLIMAIAGGFGFIGTRLLNTAIWLDRLAGDIRDGS